MDEYLEFRKAKDDFFANDPHSPLTRKQKEDFQGLLYFPANKNLRLELELEQYPQIKTIQMQTNTGDIQEYERLGKVRFSIENTPVELTIYRSDSGYFMPFVDGLAGKETYPAGRYLEPEPLGGNLFLVDFNLAYNPYCAYNDRWSCPLTPPENRLKAPVRAGEKIFHHE